MMLQQKESQMRSLIVLAIPMIISQGASALMIFTDRYFLSMVSPLHMTSALGGGMMSMLTQSLFIGVLAYGNALVAQYLGAGKLSKCSKVVTQSGVIIAAGLPVLALVTLAVRPLFGWMGHHEDQVALEVSYFIILQGGALFALSNVAFASFFAGIGRTRIVMIVDSLAVAVNIPLSYIFIHGGFGIPPMGIEGAGWSTVLSLVLVTCLYSLAYLEKQNVERFFVRTSLVPDMGILKRYLRLGLPSGIEASLNIAAMNLFILMFQSLGIVEGASAAIVFNWDMLSFIPMTGLGIAVMSLSGKYLGENDPEKITRLMRVSLTMALGYSAVLAVIFFVFRDHMAMMYLSHSTHCTAICKLTHFMLMGLITYMMADALIQVASALLAGTGDTRWLMIVSITLHWLMLGVQVLLIKVFHLGAKASWVAFVLTLLVIALALVIRLSKQRWHLPEIRLATLKEA